MPHPLLIVQKQRMSDRVKRVPPPDMLLIIERLRNENEDKTKTQMTQSFNQYSENETKIWCQNILNQFNLVSSSCLCSHFVISLMTWRSGAEDT